MAIRDSIGHCLEAAAASTQPIGVREQLGHAGEAAKIIGSLRILPRFVLRRTVQLMQREDRLPFTNMSHEPHGYGAESLVFRAGSGEANMIVKRLHTWGPFERHAADVHETYVRYRQAFGDLVLPTSFVVSESRYKAKSPILLAVQPEIRGFSYFDAPLGARVNDRTKLAEGITFLQEEYGLTPDFIDDGNVLVDNHGCIHMVDTGTLFSDQEAQRLPQLQSKLDIIRMSAVDNTPSIIERTALAS